MVAREVTRYINTDSGTMGLVGPSDCPRIQAADLEPEASSGGGVGAESGKVPCPFPPGTPDAVPVPPPPPSSLPPVRFVRDAGALGDRETRLARHTEHVLARRRPALVIVITRGPVLMGLGLMMAALAGFALVWAR